MVFVLKYIYNIQRLIEKTVDSQDQNAHWSVAYD